MTLGPLTRTRRVIVCCGSGGVGKTTTAAVLAMEGARQGRRAVVVTIDPAKRLADDLGLESLADTPTRIEGDWPGELWALMLDTKSTFDALVVKYAPSESQAQAILRNRFYRNISTALSGTQEYMAMEKLFELNDEGGFDLIVVDTPPTRNALDFIDAPRRRLRRTRAGDVSGRLRPRAPVRQPGRLPPTGRGRGAPRGGSLRAGATRPGRPGPLPAERRPRHREPGRAGDLSVRRRRRSD